MPSTAVVSSNCGLVCGYFGPSKSPRQNELPRRADAPGHSMLLLSEPDPERYP
jgi:hypothetical protein